MRVLLIKPKENYFDLKVGSEYLALETSAGAQVQFIRDDGRAESIWLSKNDFIYVAEQTVFDEKWTKAKSVPAEGVDSMKLVSGFNFNQTPKKIIMVF